MIEITLNVTSEHFENEDASIDDEALIRLREALEDYSEEMLNLSAKLAKHAGRDTITLADMELALEI